MRSAGLVGLACLMVGSAGGCRRGPSEQSDANVVVVISPHNPHIRSEFSRAFAAWHELHYGEPAELRWRDVGGTGQILKFLAGEFAAARKRGQAEAGIGVDVFFGGGPAHEQARQLGLTVPVKLPPEVLAGIPAELNGVRLYHRQGYWFGTALSSFGIIYYRRGLEQLHLPPPQRWADLADPRYYGRLILADASKSGSARACYEMILQRYGWRKGLPLLLRIAANTRQFVESSSIVPREVAKGSALAGMCIDFYGY
ncbi:MAG: ABC transporter substrate-binding protein, partial [Phycisphaerae bacterium]